ncbi:unnamed protein product [Darwinula stevensoni]|uniref:Uncharacterized protein n=1 Tax=Darwinula stevensoni TaxID=69355 RepID=A0A7R8X7E7_9CRUS|nr:unnamed protein product [Darwinula stevensoni]CAG0888597.1 unnamed protein product [Darwinula stevensoni]
MNETGKIYRMNPHNWDLDEITDNPMSVDCAFAGMDRKLYVTEKGEMKMFDLEKREWKEGPKPLEYLHDWLTTAVSPGSIFICGGRNQNNAEQKSVFCFSVETGQWIRLCDMKYERSSLGTCYGDSCLHVIGGMTNSTKHERLDLRTSRWEELATLPVERWSHAVSPHEDHLLLAGGSGGREVFVYDRRSNSWREGPSMMEERDYHGLICWNRNLYAVGGWENSSVEVFDGTKWEIIKKYKISDFWRACRMMN